MAPVPGNAITEATSTEQTLNLEADLGIDQTNISQRGDLLLLIQHTFPRSTTSCNPSLRQSSPDLAPHAYRVESSHLKTTSAYFRNLLDSEKFREGALVSETHRELRSKYKDLGNVPPNELPRIAVEDVGRISPVRSPSTLMADFLRVLHDQDLSNTSPSVASLANLVVVADRFDALPAVKAYIKRRKLMNALDGKTQDRTLKAMPEERVRQRLYVGAMLDNPFWVYNASVRLIHRGGVGNDFVEGAPLWWDLPMGIEEELLVRREYILDTVQSLQSHFLGLYTSRERQCKLGYDSSPECDIYQLGQMVRFFDRIKTISLGGAILPATGDDIPEPYAGDILDLIDSLRQCPEYQIDKNHSHCGLRTRLMPLLDLIQYSSTEAGVCMICWEDCRQEYAWSRVKRPLTWTKDSAGSGIYHQYKKQQAHSHLLKHLDTRDMFMARDRLWT